MKQLAALFLVLAALVGGLYFSNVAVSPARRENVTHRFALTAVDAKDSGDAPEIAVDAGGRVFLLWSSKTSDKERILSLATSDDAGRQFGPPRVIARSGIFTTPGRGKRLGHEVRMAPHLAMSHGAVHLAWTETLPNIEGVRLVAVTSDNRGDSFAAPAAVHHGDGARAAYTSLAAGRDGTLLSCWLDGRNGSQQAFAAIRPAGSAAFSSEQLVHAGEPGKGVCPCCPTACVLAADGTAFVAFRNVAGEHRDIVVGRKLPGDTGYDIFLISPPRWVFHGCPHDGPSLAVVEGVLHVVWMDAHTGSQRVYHAAAQVGDMKFTVQPISEIADGSQGHPKIVADAAGNIHAVWDESREPSETTKGAHNHGPRTGESTIMTARLTGTTFGPSRAVSPRAGASQTRPSVAFAGSTLFVAWNELDAAGKAVVVSTVK